MRFTLLEMVQEILSAMDSDEVNSISDTVESMQVATILRSVFYDLAVDLALPEHETLFELNASGDITKPALMTVPTNVVTMRNLRYDTMDTGETTPNFVEIKYMPFEDFLNWTEGFRNDEDAVEEQQLSFNGELFPFLYKTDRWPMYYTTADDQQIIFDAVKIDVDSTLQKSKTMCMGNVYPVFTMQDNFTPDLDPSQFSLLKNRSKFRAFNELKQVVNEEAAAEARRQKVIVQKRKRKTPDEPEVYKVPRYGRR